MNDDFRYEKKFILNNFNLSCFEELTHLIDHDISQIFSPRIINSLYFDTEDLKLAKQNIEGISNRYKIRLRYYGEIDELKDPTLEIKSKLGDVGKKYRINLKKDELIKNNFSLEFLLDNIQLPINLINYLSLVQPKILVSYFRKYYLSECSDYRFTFDTNLSFSSINNYYDFISINKNLDTINLNILEIKYNKKMNSKAYKLTNKLPFRLTNCSKYIMGLKQLGLI